MLAAVPVNPWLCAPPLPAFAVLPLAAPESIAELFAVLPLAAPVLNAELFAVLPLAAPVLPVIECVCAPALCIVIDHSEPVYPLYADNAARQ
jgi:hypothetical protein